VGTLTATCAPLACALDNAAVSVIPLPETWAPAACADLSGAMTVMVAPPPGLPGPPGPKTLPTDATTAASWLAPLSIVIAWPDLSLWLPRLLLRH